MVDMVDDELSEKVHVYLKNMEIMRPYDRSVSPINSPRRVIFRDA
jgi:hypothetical protein